MTAPALTWIASYPRSGNTYLRTILHHAFGLRTASMYSDDLGGNKTLEEYVGHIEHHPQLEQTLYAEARPLIKTHELPNDDRAAIYIIRDGRAAVASMYEFFGRKTPLEDIIEGRTRYGQWGQHLQAWNPWERPNTLLLRYDDLVEQLPQVLEQISAFLDLPIKSQSIPKRNTIASSDGRWVKKKTSWRSLLQGATLQRFTELNREMLKKTGYL
ncbi:MAG: sulfotransferase domain-containing protein [Oleiphilaceae bacterium]|nr:sulfotransferase domain-containing protein [Oleiphilaceae bacterium]